MEFPIVLWAALAVGVTAAGLWIIGIVGLLSGQTPRRVLIAASVATVASAIIQIFA